MAWISWWRTWATRRTTTTRRKSLRWSSKNLRWKRMYLLLRADQRPRQNHEHILLPIYKKVYLSVKDLGLILSQKLIRLSLTQCQNDWLLFFVVVIYFEKKMERLNSGDYRSLRNEFEYSQHWSDEMGKSKMAGGGENKKRFQYCTEPSELFMVFQDALPLILHYRTMSWFQTVSSSTFITSDVQSMYIPS